MSSVQGHVTVVVPPLRAVAVTVIDMSSELSESTVSAKTPANVMSYGQPHLPQKRTTSAPGQASEGSLSVPTKSAVAVSEPSVTCAQRPQPILGSGPGRPGTRPA